jgi:coenzyme F420-reducing hydrogenase gamma subunit
MRKTDYIRAAEIVRTHFKAHVKGNPPTAEAIREAFVAFFRGDNPLFDVDRFRSSCEAVNVRVRKEK